MEDTKAGDNLGDTSGAWNNNREIMGNGGAMGRQWETIWKQMGGKWERRRGTRAKLEKQWRENRARIERRRGDKVPRF